MNFKKVTPGRLIAINFNLYQHWAIVSEKVDSDGKYFLISATERNRTVKEEPWDKVVQGKPFYVIKQQYKKSLEDVLDYARSQIDVWQYSVAHNNCEHFAKASTGLPILSKQVTGATAGAVTGYILAKCGKNKPSTKKQLGFSLMGSGLGLLLNRAPR